MATAQPLSIDVVSDVVCPWCYVGLMRLDQAIAQAPKAEVEVRWRPFQLDPTIPREGVDRQSYMQAKFGTGGRLKEVHDRLESLGAAVGIDFDFDAIKVSPNTLDAHRLLRWAGSSGSSVQHDLKRRLMSYYFEKGRNIGDPAVLVEAAGESGMDTSVVEAMLASDADTEAVREEIETAQRMGITGVPCFLFERKYAVMGAQEVDALADAIRQVATAKASGQFDAEA
jgi:predicted DsbA family dithiol-disulfide isomerase